MMTTVNIPFEFAPVLPADRETFQARRNEAAAAVLIRRTMNGGARDGASGISLEQLQELAADPRARRRFFQIRNPIQLGKAAIAN